MGVFYGSTDWFQGKWGGGGKDYRWYRSTKTYLDTFNIWKKAGGLGKAVEYLKASDPKTFAGLSAQVSDATARRYLELSRDALVTEAQRKEAQALYERDLFEWWWTSLGFSLDYADEKGVKKKLRSGVMMTTQAIFEQNGSVLIDYEKPGVLSDLAKRDPKTRTPSFVSFTLKRPEGASSHLWWRATDWFKGIRDGQLSFRIILNGGPTYKTWSSIFVDLSKTDLSKYSKPFADYVRRVAKAVEAKDTDALTVGLEQWLTIDPAIFQNVGLPRGRGVFVDEFISASGAPRGTRFLEEEYTGARLQLGPNHIDIEPVNNIPWNHLTTPYWRTPHPSKPGEFKPATDDTNTLLVFGDSHSATYGLPNGYADSWAAQIANFLSPEQRAAFRVENYAFNGKRTDELLRRVRGMLDYISAMKGRKTAVLYAAANDTSTADYNENWSRNTRTQLYRYQTNTFANLREMAMLLASRGVHVILMTSPGVPLSELDEIAKDVRATHKDVQVTAIDPDVYGGDPSASKGAHRDAEGNKKLAKGLSELPAFQAAVFGKSIWTPASYKPDAAHWWRSHAWFVHQIIGSGDIWSAYWASERGAAANKAYAERVSKAVNAHKANPPDQTYNTLAALFEEWLSGALEGTTRGSRVQDVHKAVFTFGPNAVTLGDRVFDPDGSGNTYPPMVRPGYKAPPWNSAAYKPDAAHWWRSHAWFMAQALGTEGGWKSFWTSDRGAGVDAAYAGKVKAAFEAHATAPSDATYTALAGLFQQWASGQVVPSGTYSAARLLSGALVFGANNVTQSGKVFDPDGGQRKYGPMQKPGAGGDPTPPAPPKAWDASKYVAPSGAWWRSHAWFMAQALGTEGGWKSFWTSDRGAGVDAAYAGKVKAAFEAHATAPSDATYTALAELFQQWASGKVVPSGTYSAARLLSGALVFGANSVTQNGKVFDPDGGQRKYGPMQRPGAGGDPTPPEKGSKTIIVAGDSLSDINWNDGVWTRELIKSAAALGYNVLEVATGGYTTRPVKGRASDIKTDLFNALKSVTKPGLVIISGGVNNLQFGITLEQTRADLEEMVKAAKRTGGRVLLIATYLPPALRKTAQVTDADKKYLRALYQRETAGKTDADVNWADLWSRGLQAIYDSIAKAYASDKSFGYVPNYWDPIDGDNSLETLKKNLDGDGIHPRKDQEKALFAPIWSKIQSLLNKPATTPLPDPAIKNFTLGEFDAGQFLRLNVNLEPAKSESILRVRFWAKINDPRAGDKNNSYAESGYVNFKAFEASFDDGKTWVKYDNYRDKAQEIKIPANTKTVLFRFETFKNPPYDFQVYANIGSRSFDAFVDKDVSPYKLFIRDKGDPSELFYECSPSTPLSQIRGCELRRVLVSSS